MAELQKQLDTATLGPVTFLFKSLGSALSGVGQLLKSPKLLLPTIALSGVWLALSYLKLLMPTNEMVGLFSLLTFAQGGMVAGPLGAAGGILGKAMMSWLLTSALMPLLTGQKRPKSVKMKIGPAFAISGGRGFALFFAGIGMALILYNFKTGNGSAQNAAVAVAAILGAWRSLKNPRGFIVEFVRSFSKGRLSRRRAGHFVVGLMAGYAAAIYIAFSSGLTGPQWYIFGAGCLALAAVFGVLFKNRRRVAAAMSLLLVLGVVFGPAWLLGTSAAVHAQPQSSAALVDPYALYNLSSGDFEGLSQSLQAKPFGSAELEPVGIIMGTSYTPITNMPSFIISRGDQAVIELNVASASLEEEYNKTESYSLSTYSFSGQFSIYYDPQALDSDQPYDYMYNERILPFTVESAGAYRGSLLNRSEFGDGDPALNFAITTGREAYPIVFDTYNHLFEAYYSAGERALYGPTMYPGDNANHLYILAKLAQGTQASFSDGSASEAQMDGIVVLRVNGVSFGDAAATTVKGQWLLKETNYYAFVPERYPMATVEYFTGAFQERMGVENDGRTLYHSQVDGGKEVSNYQVTFGEMPKQLSSEQQVRISIDAQMMLNGNTLDQRDPNSRVVYGMVYHDRRPNEVNHSQPLASLISVLNYQEGEFVFNMPQGVNAGQEVTIETIMGTYMWPDAMAIGHVYVWDPTLVPAGSEGDDGDDAEGADGDAGDADEGDEGGTWLPGDWSRDGSGWDNWDDWSLGNYDWDARTGEEETAMVNLGTALGSLIGAGAAAAAGIGGFGGPRGPGNMRIPGGEYDPRDGTLVVTFPGGSKEIYRLNPQTGEFESSYGSTLNVGDLERANRDLTIDKELAKAESQRVAERSDGDTGYWNRVHTIDRLKNKYEKEATDGNDPMASHLAKHFERIQKQMNKGNGIDEKSLSQLREFIGKKTRGELANADEIPGDYTNWQHAKDIVNMTTEEVARGESGLAISLRIAAGIATAGKSEFGFEIARSVYTTKDLVNQGADDWSEVAAKLALQTIAEEGIGRVVGAGLSIGGSVAGSIAKTASDAISSTRVGSAILKKAGSAATKLGDFLGQDLGKTAKDIFGMGPKVANEASQAMKAANAKAAKQAIKAANQQLDDAVKAAGKQADDVAKAAAKQADDVAKSVGKQGEDVAKLEKSAKSPKSAAKQADEAAEAAAKPAPKKDATAPEKPIDPHAKAQKQWDDTMKKGEDQAQDEIQKYKDSSKGQRTETSKRDELFKRGQQIGDQKVANLKRAQDRMKAYPGNREAQEAYDQALRAVQQDKYAMNSLKEYSGPGANELRGNFNMRNEQHTQASLQNTRERLAQERGVNPEDIKIVEATNTPGAGGAQTIDASRTAGRVDTTMHTNPNYRGTATADDIVPNSARIKGAPMDKDVTARIYDRKTGEWIDLPKDDVQRIYNQELYKSHHGGALPRKTVNGVEIIDEDMVNGFAHKMDHTVTDRTSADAFGTGDRDLQNILDKRTRHVKEFDDITSVTQTMEYKSNEWFQKADLKRENAMKLAIDKNNKSAVEQLLRQAEADQAEGVRQLVKMFDDQVAQQIKAVTAAGRNMKMPDKLVKSVRILNQIGKPDGITMAQAESILKSMNTSIDDVVQQTSSLMEVIAKFR